MVMPKINLTLNDETSGELKKLSDKENKPVAVLIREAIAFYLNQKGSAIDTRVSWGGPRSEKDADDAGA